MTSKKIQSDNGLEWDTVRKLLQQYKIRQSVVNNVLEKTKELPRVPINEEK